MPPLALTEFADIGAFEFELTLDKPILGDEGDILADLTVRSPETFLSLTVPMMADEIRDLADWLKAVLSRYDTEQRLIAAGAE